MGLSWVFVQCGQNRFPVEVEIENLAANRGIEPLHALLRPVNFGVEVSVCPSVRVRPLPDALPQPGRMRRNEGVFGGHQELSGPGVPLSGRPADQLAIDPRGALPAESQDVQPPCGTRLRGESNVRSASGNARRDRDPAGLPRRCDNLGLHCGLPAVQQFVVETFPPQQVREPFTGTNRLSSDQHRTAGLDDLSYDVSGRSPRGFGRREVNCRLNPSLRAAMERHFDDRQLINVAELRFRSPRGPGDTTQTLVLPEEPLPRDPPQIGSPSFASIA